MYRVWYWAMIDREHDGRLIASIPDLRLYPVDGCRDAVRAAIVAEHLAKAP
jgi:hypothetical protein